MHFWAWKIQIWDILDDFHSLCQCFRASPEMYFNSRLFLDTTRNTSQLFFLKTYAFMSTFALCRLIEPERRASLLDPLTKAFGKFSFTAKSVGDLVKSHEEPAFGNIKTESSDRGWISPNISPFLAGKFKYKIFSLQITRWFGTTETKRDFRWELWQNSSCIHFFRDFEQNVQAPTCF